MKSQDILDAIGFDASVKEKLMSAYQQHSNNPRMMDRTFEAILADVDWHWPELERYPDTLSVMDMTPAILLGFEMLRNDALDRRKEQWLRVTRTRPYAIVKTVGDKPDFPECKAMHNMVVTVDDISTPVFPPHRLGCRCHFLCGTEKQLDKLVGK